MSRNTATEILVVGGLVVFLQLAAQEQWPYSFYFLLRLYVCSAVACLGWSRIKENRAGWFFFYFPVLVLFNPLDKPGFPETEWRVIDLASALIFGVILATAMWRSSQSSLPTGTGSPPTVAVDPPSPAVTEPPSPKDTGIEIVDHAIEHAANNADSPTAVSENENRDAQAAEALDAEIAGDLRSAECGDVGALVRLGLHCLRQRDPTGALNWLLQPAYAGDAEAAYLVGCMYSSDRFLPLDLSRAAVWIERAAKSGYVDAQSRLAWLYHVGHGVPQDDTTAASWFNRAAEAGDLGAQNNVRILQSLARGERRQPNDSERSLMTSLGFNLLEDLELWMNIPADPVVGQSYKPVYPTDASEDDDLLREDT